uniref:Deoxynucleoside kinase domain-containing protein n=1 Tax=Ditylenchus dipsaci TaxID=166011 RepID=A0A915DTI2_9BILA
MFSKKVICASCHGFFKPFGCCSFGRSSTSLLLPFSQNFLSQSRNIVSEALLKLPDNYPEPWPYKEKSFNWFHALYDETTKRFHENSKLIILEGNVGSGKTKVGQEIADGLGFQFMPEFKMDDILTDRYGNDMRNFYHLFPKRFRIPDAKRFFDNPYDDLSAVMQDRIYFCRFEQYANALAHILNTGQGVVLERSVYADFVFANAMRSQNYIGEEYFKHYYYVRKMTLPDLKLYPHLMIYLDCPVSKCLETSKIGEMKQRSAS